ncbi:hypothetical protein [Rhizobium sp. BK176]|uniref:hypothetical protein n=1 Tax=Rhizobium sp. BK176 TaxID=2587071 RepID=UPI002168A153|nr:hypothetical protein [Rhizobium sp. BK176]MCS4089425.1 hypothetical protein [Rhizobium sp. BK176]
MGMLARGRKKIFGERITLPLSEEMLVDIDRKLGEGEARLSFLREAIQRELDRRSMDAASYYVSAALSDLVHGNVFFKLEFRNRDTVLFEFQDYRKSGEEAISAVLERGTEFGVDAVIVTGTMPGAINRKDEEDARPYVAARTYVHCEGGFQPLREFPVNHVSWADVEHAFAMARRARERKVPNATTVAAMEEARAIRASGKSISGTEDEVIQ